MAWVQHMVKSMKSSGHDSCSTSRRIIRKAAEGKCDSTGEQDLVEAVWACNIYGTQLAVNIMILRQNKDAAKKGKYVY